MRNRRLMVGVGLVFLVSACGPKGRSLAPESLTWGELRTVRSGVMVASPDGAKRVPAARERLVDGEKIVLDDGALVWIRRDGGATALAGGPGSLEMTKGALKLDEGHVFLDVPGTQPVELHTPRGAFRLANARVSFRVREGIVRVYVLKGRVAFGQTVAGPGQRIEADANSSKVVEVAAWHDWTGGLATTDAMVAPTPFGVGTIGARIPGNKGAPRWPLVVRKMDVRVSVTGDLATTEVKQTFFNPRSETVEGIYQFRTPPGAILDRFGVDRRQGIVWGFVKEQEQAAKQYASHVYKGSRENPALLSWEAPGVYKARIYPIHAGESRKLVTRYSEWLTRTGAGRARRMYVYPMAAQGTPSSLPRIEELTIRVDLSRAGASRVRTGMQGQRVGDAIIVRKHDYVPRADFAVELFDQGKSGIVAYRAPHRVARALIAPNARAEADRLAKGQKDYLMVPVPAVQSPSTAKGSRGVNLAIVVDSSAATSERSLAISRAMVSALLAHMNKDDRVAVWAGDERIHSVVAGTKGPVPVTDAFRRKLRDGMAGIVPGGATDLASLLSEAARGMDATRRFAVVYIGDGTPTVGEMALGGVRKQLQRLPRPVRLFTLGVGEDVNMSMLTGLSHGGFAARVTSGREAAMTALRVLEQVGQPAWIQAKVDLGSGVQNLYPRDVATSAPGQSLLLVGRPTGKVPSHVTLTTPRGKKTFSLQVKTIDDHGDLMRRWAQGRLVGLLDRGVGRAAVVEVGMRYGMVTPFTSLYVPTTAEARRLGVVVDRSSVRGESEKKQAPEKSKSSPGSFIGKLVRKIGGVAYDKATAAAPEQEEDNREGGSGTRAKGEQSPRTAAASPVTVSGKSRGGNARKGRRDANRYGVKGPKEDSAPMAETKDEAERDLERAIQQKKRAKRSEEAGDETTAVEDMPAAPPTGGVGLGSTGEIGHGAGTGRASLGRFSGSRRRRPSEHRKGKGEDKGIAGFGHGTGRGMGRGASSDDQDEGGFGLGLSGFGRGGGGSGTGRGFGSGHGQSYRAPKAGERNKSRKLRNQASADGLFGTLENEVARAGRARHGLGAKISVEVQHRPLLCGGGAKVTLKERMALWRERLAARGRTPYGALSVYRQALLRCEAPTWRERSVLLALMVDNLRTVTKRVALWRLLASRPGIGDAVYAMILTRIRTANQLRRFHAAIGLKHMDPEALKAALSHADTAEKRIDVLKGIAKLWPDDTAIALKLIYALEDARRVQQARDLAFRLRHRRDLGAATRTEIGELFLRLSNGKPGNPDVLEANRSFGELVEFSPQDPVARRRLGDLLRAHGQFEQAARQYATLARLAPDDGTVLLLQASAAQGQGKVEEAVRWAEKAAASNAPDAVSDLAKTSRAMAITYLFWAADKARTSGDKKTLGALNKRIKRFEAADRGAKGVRVSLIWSHPDFHPVLWSDALGTMMPAATGNPLLGVWQTVVPSSHPAMIEVRLGDEDIERAVRFGVEAVLTVMTSPQEPPKLVKVRFTDPTVKVLRFQVADGKVTQVKR